jgi:polyphosphate kinase 2 (PPK2 family)
VGKNGEAKKNAHGKKNGAKKNGKTKNGEKNGAGGDHAETGGEGVRAVPPAIFGQEPLALRALDQEAYRCADKETYESELKRLQEKMLAVQQTYFHEKRRGIIVFEGWDAAGKGGAIRRLTAPLDPRGFKVWPIGAPEPKEQGRHYLYRFWTKLPPPGEIAVFDRSWYGRVLVERVESLAQKDQWSRAYDEINTFEKMLSDDGVRLIKLFLHITPDEQLERFAARLKTPEKRWKFTAEDIRNRERWPAYETAVEEMLQRTSRPNAPWAVVPANYKWGARLAALSAVTAHLAEGVSLKPPPIDPALLAAARKALGLNV